MDFIEEIISKKKLHVLSVGCGNGYLEQELLNKYPNIIIDGIDIKSRSTEHFKGFNFIQGNFISHGFKKKYDIILFVNSLQFILGQLQIDKKYIEFIKQKLISLLKPNGKIYIKVTNKKWFQENKETSDEFIKTLTNCITNILKMKFNILMHKKMEYHTYIILKN